MGRSGLCDGKSNQVVLITLLRVVVQHGSEWVIVCTRCFFALGGGGASAHSGYPLGLRALWKCASSDFLSSAVLTYCQHN